MLNKYEKWIEVNYPNKESSYLKCKEAVGEMQAEFPELSITKGHCVDLFDYKYPHWWLKTKNGEIIDPTRKQFNFSGDYIEHIGEEPRGKCLQCGEYSYYSREFCSEDCLQKYENMLLNKD